MTSESGRVRRWRAGSAVTFCHLVVAQALATIALLVWLTIDEEPLSALALPLPVAMIGVVAWVLRRNYVAIDREAGTVLVVVGGDDYEGTISDTTVLVARTPHVAMGDPVRFRFGTWPPIPAGLLSQGKYWTPLSLKRFRRFAEHAGLTIEDVADQSVATGDGF